jgi:nitrogen fixation NifU-like protein
VSSTPSPTPGRLEELYQSVILDHNRRPRNYGEMPDATARAEGTNPVCGDQVSVWLRLDGDLIADLRFKGTGCAISRASASIMTAAVKGKTIAEAEHLFERFHGLVTGRTTAGGETLDRADAARSLEVFSGVARFPVRVKCATLSWHALRSALEKAGGGRLRTRGNGSVGSEEQDGSGPASTRTAAPSSPPATPTDVP